MRHFRRLLLLLVAFALIGWVPPGSAAAPGAAAAPAPGLAAPVTSCRALLYPPYSPAKNYCGPEWLQEAGWGWLVPRDPVSGFDFSPACYTHDACYTECCQSGMAQADCDGQFLANLQNVCTQTRDALLAECSGLSYVGCVIATLARSVLCTSMAGTYAEAVSYLGDGVIETQALALLLAPLGPAAVGAAFAVATLAGDMEIEAAYPCPCACLTCPPDEPVEEPTCQESVLRGAFVTQDVLRYEKQGSNVSGVGPVCDCVGAEITVTSPCPEGTGCALEAPVCAADICDAMTCNQTGLRARCEEHGVSIGGSFVSLYATVITEWIWSTCEDVDQYRSQCVTHAREVGDLFCLGGCAPDGRSCALNPLNAAALQVSEPASYHATNYVPCRGCRIQLQGAGGTFQGVTDDTGNLTITGIPAGVYLVNFGCGRSGLGPHLPSDLAQDSSPPAFWLPATAPFMSTEVPASNVVVPTGEPVATLTGRCGQPTCSAVELSPVPTDQDLPDAVAATRQQIIEAAVECNYDALAELASSPYFHYAPGESGDPVGYWRSQEEGPMGVPLLRLVETLNMPFATVEPEGDLQYLWPAEWADDYEFTGYRVIIHNTGEWLAYLVGEW
ncbi:MAG TPA: hypothetical protein VLS92_09040 [Acidimicrobiia bacterium]|nr:hypothetical protein [Acidimicrobiia bacterium]